MEVESKQFTLQTRKHFPRHAKYDVDPKNNTITAKILLDGSVIQEHSITESRNTKRRLIKEANGDKLSVRFTGDNKGTIYAAEVE
jgi:nucleoid-associated protein YgaU